MCGSLADIQPATAEIRRGKKTGKGRRRRRQKKLQSKNIVACPILLGGHKIVHGTQQTAKDVQKCNLCTNARGCFKLFVKSTLYSTIILCGRGHQKGNKLDGREIFFRRRRGNAIVGLAEFVLG